MPQFLRILERPRDRQDPPGPSDHPLWAVPYISMGGRWSMVLLILGEVGMLVKSLSHTVKLVLGTNMLSQKLNRRKSILDYKCNCDKKIIEIFHASMTSRKCLLTGGLNS